MTIFTPMNDPIFTSQGSVELFKRLTLDPVLEAENREHAGLREAAIVKREKIKSDAIAKISLEIFGDDFASFGLKTDSKCHSDFVDSNAGSEG